MLKKLLIASTQIIQPVFASRRFDEAIFGTTAVAHELHFAGAAIFGERVAFIGAEFALEIGIN